MRWEQSAADGTRPDARRTSGLELPGTASAGQAGSIFLAVVTWWPQLPRPCS